MRDVKNAQETQSRTKRYACYAAMAIAFFFVLSLSGGEQESSEIVSGQAKRPTVKHGGIKGSDFTPKQQSSKGKDFGDQGDSFDEDVEYDLAKDKFDRVIRDQKAMNENMISEEEDKRMTKIGDKLDGLLDQTGQSFSDEEKENILNDIRAKLEKYVNRFIDDATAELLTTKKSEFEVDLDRDDKGELGEEEAEGQMDDIVDALRSGVDDICNNAKDKVKEMSGVAEKKVLEDALEEKTSKSYTAELEDHVVVSIKASEKKESEDEGDSGSSSDEDGGAESSSDENAEDEESGDEESGDEEESSSDE